MKVFGKRIISWLLTVAMMASMLPMTVLANESEETAENSWNGKSAVFVGDSITAGTGTTKIYYEYLEESLGFGSVTAMGVPGSCISAASDYGQSTKPLIGRYQNIPSADLIVVFMGTNDYGHETPLGSEDDTQDGTFYGALNTIVPALVAKHSSSKIVFVTSLHRYGYGTSKILGTKFTYDHIPNGVGATLGDYVDALKAVCANNGVSVIDLHTECTMDPTDSAVRSTYIPDGLHPNAAGHELIAGIMESHIRSYEPVEKAPEIETEPEDETELIYGNKFTAGFDQKNRASARINQYLKAGTVITLKDPETFQWGCAKTTGENSNTNLGYFPDAQWTDKETAVVAADGWVGFVFKYRDETKVFDLTKPLSDYIIIEEPHTHSYTPNVTVPTCTEQGYTTYTCECGDSYVADLLDALDHDYLASIIYPAGVINGCTDYTCSLCGDAYRTPWLDENAYEGKTIACVGDSITAAVGVTKDENDYVKLLADQLGLNYIRLGASGTTLCTDGPRTCNIIRLTESYLKGADVVTIAMGINDFCAAAEGSYELGDIDSTDSSTIYGAVRMWCERIEELRKTDSLRDTQFYFVTPVICSWNNSVTNQKNWDQSKTNIHGYTLRDLCNAIIEVAALYDVAVIDLNLVSGMYYVDAQDNNTAVFGGDGVHPGANGHAMMAAAIANALLQNDLRNDHVHTFGSWITTTWPSCYAGEQQRVCTVCSATESRSLEHHEYSAVITAPTCTEKGYTTYTCVCGDSYVDDYVGATGHAHENGTCIGCGVAQWDTDGDGTLEILAIGNSFSVDALEYAYQIAQDLGIQEIVLGNLYIGGCSLNTHATNAAGDLAKYTYYYNDSGSWKTTSKYKISTALESRSWDYVSLQQASNYSGVESTYNKDLTDLIAYVKERSDAKLVWHMTWAYQQNSTHSAFPTYNKDQMTMYNAIVSAVQNKIVTNSDIDLIVPNGTAVQNSRTSLLGDTTTRDGYHMSYDYGRYLTGLLFIKTVTGLSVDDITYAPSGVDAEEKNIAVESANNAFAKPFEVTRSAYVKVEPEMPDEGYILLKPELHKGSYWHSINADHYNTLVTDASNSKYFFATIRFTRETLPVGSIIILEDGWQYRPEGWITDAVQSSRADTTTESYVVVTEEWWDDYTIRSFNISRTSGGSVMDLTEEEMRELFQIYVPEEKHSHDYTSVVTAPTCTEQGYTTHTCTLCGDSYVGDLLDATGHSYENGLCSACGTEHPNLANYEGKVISILGDSISTFAGYIPTADGFNLEHRARYPQDNLLTDVNETWWMQLLDGFDAKLGINESWAGSTVINTIDGNSGDVGEDAAMASVTRIKNLGANGMPDVILFFGGGNDMGRNLTAGSFDPEAAPTEVDLTATKWESFADAYVAAIMRLQHFYPDSEIVAINVYAMPSYVTEAKLDKYEPIVEAICEHYGVKYVGLRDCGITFGMLPDDIHPNAEGMDCITEKVLDFLTNECDLEPGENVVYSVTHELNGVTASLGYYKGVSAGKAFAETVEGEDFSVTVTMGGEDITDSVYADGKISIPEVTGDVVISAKGKFNADGHLQQLPEEICAGTNLWTALEPENTYYLGSEWGLYSNSPDVHSITFPVNEGERIFATSFGAASNNGDTANGTRITWFSETGVLESVARDVVYDEFAANGYITVPEGAVAVNIPHRTADSKFEVYLLDREHDYENGICVGCGTTNGPIITQQPVDGAAKLGERYMVEVKAEGESLKYQWYFRNAGSNQWYKSSVKDNTYDDVMTEARAGREVYCVITDANGNSVTTDTVKLICRPSEELAIVTQPTDGEAVLGERYCVSVEAKGEGLKYQWYFRNKGAKNWTKSSVTDNTYDDVMTTARDGREVYCVITDLAGNKVTTDIVKLVRVPMKLEITSQPTDAKAAIGEIFCATVEAKGEGLKYQWYYRNAGGLVWYKSGVRDNTYDDVMTTARAGREVYCVITDAHGNSVTTDTVKLICIPAELEIVTQPTDARVCFDEMFCATVEAEGDGLKYQWYYRNAGSDKWYTSGVRDNTYDDIMTKARNGREIYCVITDAYGNTVTTDVVKLTAVPKVELKLLGQSYESAAMGETYCVTVEAQGEGLAYQWYFRNAGSNTWYKSGVTDNTYNDVMTKARANREVYCVITDAFGNQVTTEVAVLKEKANIVVDAFSDISQFLAAQTSSQTSVGAAQLANVNLYPIFYNTNTAYANSKLRSVDIPVKTVSSLTESQTITLYVADSSILNTADMSAFLASDAVRAYTIVVDVSEYSSTAIRDLVTVDLSGYDIFVGENDLIGFGSVEDTVAWTLLSTRQTSPVIHEEMYLSYTSGNKLVGGGIHYSMLFNFGIEVSDDRVTDGDSGDGAFGDGDSGEEDTETEVPDEGGDTSGVPEDYSGLEGLKLSILGDSISTYKEYSNDAANTNSTIGSNNVYYNGKNGLTGVEDTWWMQTVNDTGMHLLVNNSWSGSFVVGGLKSVDAGAGNRAENLHDNTGDNAGTLPDVIAVYMGTNDLSKKVGDYTSAGFYDNLYVDSDGDGVYDDPTTFAHAYAIMLDKITKAYPEAEIFTFTILANNWVNASVNEKINAAIQEISTYYGATVVDIYRETGITAANAGEYMLDNEKTHIHPNEAGMDLIAGAFKKALLEKFQGQ